MIVTFHHKKIKYTVQHLDNFNEDSLQKKPWHVAIRQGTSSHVSDLVLPEYLILIDIYWLSGPCWSMLDHADPAQMYIIYIQNQHYNGFIQKYNIYFLNEIEITKYYLRFWIQLTRQDFRVCEHFHVVIQCRFQTINLLIFHLIHLVFRTSSRNRRLFIVWFSHHFYIFWLIIFIKSFLTQLWTTLHTIKYTFSTQINHIYIPQYWKAIVATATARSPPTDTRATSSDRAVAKRTPASQK